MRIEKMTEIQLKNGRRVSLRPAMFLRFCAAGALAVIMAAAPVMEACAGMEAPGNGGPGWHYSQKDYHWYYFEPDNGIHTGWLNYEGEWYWFDSFGRMEDGGSVSVDGKSYYFFINGHLAWNQFVGFRFMDENGLHDENHDFRIIGGGSAGMEERDMVSDYLYEVPRSWIAAFMEDGWQFMYYTKKKYFAAPNTNMGIYYVYHNTDTNYKKVKLCDADSVLQGFGEYVGYAAGCYRKGNLRMHDLWKEYPVLSNLLEIPDYYAEDGKFYFGKIFAAYLDEEKREDMRRLAPGTCRIMEEILHMKDDDETRARLEREEKEQERKAAERAQRVSEAEGYGPGVKRSD